MSGPAAAPATPQQRLDRALLHLRRGEPALAEAVLAELRRFHPRQPQVLHLSGVAALQQGRPGEAADFLGRALRAAPGSAPAAADFGLALTRLGRLDEAEARLREALRLRPDFPEAWLNLGNIHRERAEQDAARRTYLRALSLRPAFPEAHNNLALVLLALGRPADAEASVRAALALRPGFAEAWQTLAMIHDDLGRFDDAVAAHRRGIELAPHRAQAHVDLGNTLGAYGKREEAAAAYRAALALEPGRASIRRLLGRLDDAAPTLAEDEVRFADPATPDEERMHLGFALGKAHEDRGDHAAAFARFAAANALMRKTFSYDRGDSEAAFAEIAASFTPQLFARHAAAGHPDPTPIFVVGMPRSGTSLVEQILASHPDVVGAGELPLMRGLVAGEVPEGETLRYGALVERLGDAGLTRLGAEYVRQLRAWSATSYRITDKMPGNFLLIGMIRLMLPRATILHCVRDPADTCVSIFKNWFAGAPLRYAYELGELGHYHWLYQGLMRHWHAVLPGVVNDVSYEALVADQEGETRRLLAACGLDFRPECLSFFDTARPVHTASAAQVRRPIGAGSVGIAARYGAALEPLRAALAGSQ